MNSHHTAENDAALLKAAMKGFGTEEDAIIKVIANRTNEQRQQIILFYKSSYGVDLIDDLKDELGGKFEDAVLALFKTPVDYDVKELYQAIKGAGTNEDTLIEIIASRPPSMLKKIKEAYKLKHGTSLEDEIVSETSDDVQRLLVSILQCNRSENNHPDDSQAKADAQELYDAGEGQWGTDESVFNKIFTLRSLQELRKIDKYYQQLSNKTLMKAVDEEFDGDLRDLLVTIVSVMVDTHAYFARRINKAVKGWGTNDNLLIRVLITRDEIDMTEIKKAYKTLYETDLIEVIKDECSGDYKNLLVELASH